MAGWLLRAIVMENVAARADGAVILLPAAPHFRIEKEIKNVITVIAKTCHYWTGHMPPAQRRAIGEPVRGDGAESPLVEPAARRTMALQAEAASAAPAAADRRGAPASAGRRHRYAGWLGVECPSVRAAVWMMRALVASNVLSRREGTVLFVPVKA